MRYNNILVRGKLYRLAGTILLLAFGVFGLAFYLFSSVDAVQGSSAEEVRSEVYFREAEKLMYRYNGAFDGSDTNRLLLTFRAYLDSGFSQRAAILGTAGQADDVALREECAAHIEGMRQAKATEFELFGTMARVSAQILELLKAKGAAQEVVREFQEVRIIGMRYYQEYRRSDLGQAKAALLALQPSMPEETGLRAAEYVQCIDDFIGQSKEYVGHSAPLREISASSSEQRQGAGQVNTAIQELNNTVQANASAANEMASGSEELSAQAEVLRSAVGFFRV